MDAKKLKRMAGNRIASRKVREKKLNYKISLETQYKNLEDQIADLKPELSCYENQKQLLKQEQLKLRERMETLQKGVMLKDAEIEKNLREVNRLNNFVTQQRSLVPLLGSNIGQLLHEFNVQKGNGVETSYIAPEPSQMRKPDMLGIDLNLPYIDIGSTETNDTSGTFQIPDLNY